MTHGDGGKGSTQRPTNYDSFSENFDRIFGKTEEMIEEDDEDVACSWCGGCGEGMYDGAACKKCHGSGIEPVEKDDDV